jgi:predicted nucleic acid-binding protein
VRVFLDSNVLVSGIAFRGNEHELLKASLDPRHTFFVSEDVLREVRAVLAEKFPHMEAEAEAFLRLLPLRVLPSTAYLGRELPPSARVDPTDAHVALAALACGAEILATGDKGLWAIGPLEGTEVLRPREALRRVRSSPA